MKVDTMELEIGLSFLRFMGGFFGMEGGKEGAAGNGQPTVSATTGLVCGAWEPAFNKYSKCFLVLLVK